MCQAVVAWGAWVFSRAFFALGQRTQTASIAAVRAVPNGHDVKGHAYADVPQDGATGRWAAWCGRDPRLAGANGGELPPVSSKSIGFVRQQTTKTLLRGSESSCTCMALLPVDVNAAHRPPQTHRPTNDPWVMCPPAHLVHDAPLVEQDERVEEVEDLGLRLVDGAHHSDGAAGGQALQQRDHRQRSHAVQATGGLVLRMEGRGVEVA